MSPASRDRKAVAALPLVTRSGGSPVMGVAAPSGGVAAPLPRLLLCSPWPQAVRPVAVSGLLPLLLPVFPLAADRMRGSGSSQSGSRGLRGPERSIPAGSGGLGSVFPAAATTRLPAALGHATSRALLVPSPTAGSDAGVHRPPPDAASRPGGRGGRGPCWSRSVGGTGGSTEVAVLAEGSASATSGSTDCYICSAWSGPVGSGCSSGGATCRYLDRYPCSPWSSRTGSGGKPETGGSAPKTPESAVSDGFGVSPRPLPLSAARPVRSHTATAEQDGAAGCDRADIAQYRPVLGRRIDRFNGETAPSTSGRRLPDVEGDLEGPST
jgi:hypothetical protein